MLTLQRLGGNRAVAAMVQRAEAERVQRQGPDDGQSAGGGKQQTQIVVPVQIPDQFHLSPWLLADASQAGAQQTGGTQQQGGGTAAQTGGQQQTATPPAGAQQQTGTPPPAAGQQQASQPAAGTQQTGGGQAAAGDDNHPRLGIDISATGTAGLGAFDTFNPSSPSTPRSLQLRGPNAAAGDFAVNGALSFVWRDKNFHEFPNGWHLGHEPTLSLGAALAPNAAGGSLSPGVSLGMDIFHRQVQTALGQLDIHALQAQIYGNLGVPLAGTSAGMPNPLTAAYGGGIGGGVELHPGHQNRVSVGAYLMMTGGGTTDMSTGNTVFNMGGSANLVITGNLFNP